MKNSPIYWLFDDGSIAHTIDRPFQNNAIAWKFESHHEWKYIDFPSNYYK